MGIAAPAVPGVGRSGHASQAARTSKVTGLSLPNMCKPYVHAGIISSIVLWNTRDLGYLTVRAAARARTWRADERGQTPFAAGRLGSLTVAGDQVLLGPSIRVHEGEHRSVRLLGFGGSWGRGSGGSVRGFGGSGAGSWRVLRFDIRI